MSKKEAFLPELPSGSRDVASVEATAPLTPEGFIAAVAEIDFGDAVNGSDTLNYAAVNVMYGRGSLPKETRRTVCSVIRTLQAVIRDAKALDNQRVAQ